VTKKKLFLVGPKKASTYATTGHYSKASLDVMLLLEIRRYGGGGFSEGEGRDTVGGRATTRKRATTGNRKKGKKRVMGRGQESGVRN